MGAVIRKFEGRTIRAALSRLDEKGRCCGRKPLTYLRDKHYFCTRCSRSFDLNTKGQIDNWAWKRQGDEFVKTTKYS
jgi:hypothetical protein